MGFLDKLFGRATPALPAVDVPPALPTVESASLIPQAGVFDATDGRISYLWSRSGVSPSFTAGYTHAGFPLYTGNPGAEIARERGAIAAVLWDKQLSDPLIGSIIQAQVSQAIGTGLVLSAKPDHELIGITEQEARDLAHAIERSWAQWASSVNADASGRFDLHSLARALFRSWLVTGEAMFVMDWKVRAPGIKSRVKVLDSRQLAQEKMQVALEGQSFIYQGVQFSADGELQGLWLRQYPLGSTTAAPQPVFVPVTTPWGRPQANLIFEMQMPGQVRGVSPLAPAVSSAQSRLTVREMAVAGFLVQSSMAISVKSNAGKTTLEEVTPDGFPGHAPQGGDPTSWLAAKTAFYQDNALKIEPGAVNHLLPGEELEMHRAQHPVHGYAEFEKVQARDTARASGMSYEEATGSFGDVNFSAARLSLDLPWRTLLTRRKIIAERIYDIVYRCFVEEFIETQYKLPRHAKHFNEAPDAFCRANWRGSGRPQPDILKQNQADAIALSQGFTTLEDIAAERGHDLEDLLMQRAHEMRMCEELGLPYAMPMNVTINSDDAADEKTNRKDK